MSRLAKPLRPILCYVTEGSGLAPLPARRAALLERIESAHAAGVDWIQIREKDLGGRELALFTRAALLAAHVFRPDQERSSILVNDRLDVALAEGAGGVHLGESGLPVADARPLADRFGASSDQPFLVGVSCHSLPAARVAADSGADYLFFGPVFATPSKAAYGAPQGLAKLADLCRAVSVPVLAIGGISVENAASCLSSGASGIAAIRLFQQSADLPALLRRLHALPLG